MLEQSVWFGIGLTWAEGFTVIVNVLGVAIQFVAPFVKVGITVIVATIGVVPVFIAVNEGILPEPVKGINPILVSKDQAYDVVPTVFVVEKFTVLVAVLLQTTWLVGWLTCPDGLTVMVNVLDVPLQIEVPL